MNKIVAGLLIVWLGVSAVGGQFIGAEFVPYTTKTYFLVGWDSGSWIKTSFGMSKLLYVDNSYSFSVTPLWNITPSFRTGGSLNIWADLENWQLKNPLWSVSLDVVGKWQGLMGWIKFNLPLEVSSNAPLLGVWVIIGVAYDFFPASPRR